MLGRAITWARDHGVSDLSASIRLSNGAMTGLIRSLGLPVTFGSGKAGVVDAVIDLRAQLPDVA